LPLCHGTHYCKSHDGRVLLQAIWLGARCSPRSVVQAGHWCCVPHCMRPQMRGSGGKPGMNPLMPIWGGASSADAGHLVVGGFADEAPNLVALDALGVQIPERPIRAADGHMNIRYWSLGGCSGENRRLPPICESV